LIAGRYRLERHLGEGGMGTVWSAIHVVTRRSVAMKFLRQAVAHKTELRQRFLREAQAASALRHPNVVEVIDVFDLPDRSPVIVMELLEGETLGEKLVRDERLSMEETAAVMLPVVSAVGAAHAHGIIHRDLKPENVFLARTNDGGSVKVLDFGIAKLLNEQQHEHGRSLLVTESGSLLGTPCYMAPEQMGNANVDFRADIWSLGVMLYECLSGTRPIEGQNMAEVFARLMGDAIVPLDRLAPELPHDVTALVQQMLTRDPNRRLQELTDLTKVLGRFGRVTVPSFGPPRSVVSDGSHHPPLRKSLPPRSDDPGKSPAGDASSASGPSVRRTTMLSAPAVGIDGRRSTTATPDPSDPAQARRTRLALAVAAAMAMGLVASLWFGRRDGGSEKPVQSPATVAAPEPRAPAKAETAPPPPAAAKTEPVPSTEASVPRPLPSSKPGRHSAGVVPKVRPPPQKPGAGQTNEEALFSGRK
jgi:serine/threonine protein kinase